MQSVIIEKTDRIARITMNKASAGNAFDKTLFYEVGQAVEKCGKDDDVSIIVITGAGKNFSVGGDIAQMSTFRFFDEEMVEKTGGMLKAVLKCPKPTVAMVNGAAAGAGMSLALACDYRILDEKSIFMTAFANVGLSGDTGCVYLLHRHLGFGKMLELMSLSEPVNAKEAYRLNLVTEIAPAGELEEKTKSFCQKLLKRPLQVIARQKRLAYEKLSCDLESYLELEGKLLLESACSEEHRNAVNSFLKK